MANASSLIELLLARLERISADSTLAHRASGVRGALLRCMELQQDETAAASSGVSRSIDAAIEILAKAAAELPSGGEEAK